jgi:hypothetical protein
VQKSVDEIEKYVSDPAVCSSNIDVACRLFQHIILFLKELKEESLWQRLARQDRNESRIEEYRRLLDEAMIHFNVHVCLNADSPKRAEYLISR